MISIENLAKIQDIRKAAISAYFENQNLFLTQDGFLLDNGADALEKAARSVGLIKKMIINSRGHRQTVWVKPGDEHKEHVSKKHDELHGHKIGSDVEVKMKDGNWVKGKIKSWNTSPSAPAGYATIILEDGKKVEKMRSSIKGFDNKKEEEKDVDFYEKTIKQSLKKIVNYLGSYDGGECGVIARYIHDKIPGSEVYGINYYGGIGHVMVKFNNKYFDGGFQEGITPDDFKKQEGPKYDKGNYRFEKLKFEVDPNKKDDGKPWSAYWVDKKGEIVMDAINIKSRVDKE